MSEHQPGTVAVATVRGVPNVRVMRVEMSNDSAAWWVHDGAVSDKALKGATLTRENDVTDIRPLVVLDLAEFKKGACNFPAFLRELAKRDLAFWIADQIEAQTKPPRIPEPGLWGVVEAKPLGSSRALQWLRVPSGVWYCTVGSRQLKWDELTDPVLVREGVEPDPFL